MALAAGPTASAADFERDVKPVLERSCYACHNPALRNADLDLTRFETEAKVLADPKTWEKVIEKTRTRQMPALPFPPLVGRRSSSSSRAGSRRRSRRQDEAAPPDPGRVTARRLNRTEYDNTVRDLLGVDLRPALDFPQDDSGYGFDNNGDVLSLSPALMERYLTAAERVARAALFGPAAAAARPRAPRRRRARGSSRRPWCPRTTTRRASRCATRSTAAPRAGDRRVRRARDPGRRAPRRLRAGRGRASSSTTSEQGVLALDPEGLGSFSRRPPGLHGQDARAARAADGGRAPAVGHDREDLYEGLPATYGGPNPSKRPLPPPREFKPPKDATPERLAKRARGLREAARRRRRRPTTRA